MKRLWTWLLVIPALGLLGTSEANAQRRGGLGGMSIGGPGFGYSSGYGRGSGFGFGTPGLGYGNSFGSGVDGWRGYNGYNNYGYGGYGGYGYSPYGYGGYNRGLSISLGGGNWNGYGNYGYNGYNNGYYSPSYSTGYYNSGYSSPSYSTGYYDSGYSSPTYSTASMPVTSSSFYQPSTYSNGTTYYSTPSSTWGGVMQSGYTTPAYSTDSGIVQSGGWSSQWNNGITTLGGSMASTSSGPAKVKLTVPDNCEVWIDGKSAEGSGTTREFTSDATTGSVKVKLKNGEQTREFTMPVRPGENSTVDLTSLMR